MDLYSLVSGVAIGLVSTGLWKLGSIKVKKYYRSKHDELEYEKERIEALSKKPSEIYRDSFKNLFYLIFLIALANIMGLIHEFIYQKIGWQHAFTECGVWLVISSLSIKYHNRIASTYNKTEAIKVIDTQIEKVKDKC